MKRKISDISVIKENNILNLLYCFSDDVYDKYYNLSKISNKSKDTIPKTNITFKNDLKLKYNLFKEKRKNINDEIDNNYNPILNDYDINELVITNNKNNYQNMKDYGNDEIININQDERIKDEYINSKLPKINTLD